MFAHPGNELLPELLAAFLVDAFVANDRELLGTGRDKNQDGITLGRFLHSKLQEFFLGAFEGAFFEFPSLKKHPDLSGGLRFRRFDRLHDAIVLELANESISSHDELTSSSRRLRRQSYPRHR